MGEPSTRHDGPPLDPDNGMSTQPFAQQQLVADELPMSEDDYALAIQSSRVLLQQINNRRYMSQHRRQHPRHRKQDTGRAVDKLAQGLNRQNLKQREPSRHAKSPLKRCMNSRCASKPTVPKPSATQSLENDIGKTSDNEGLRDRHMSGGEGQPDLSTSHPIPQSDPTNPKSLSTSTGRSRADTTPLPDSPSYSQHQRPLGRTVSRAPSSMLLEADSDEGVYEDEGFFDGPDDFIRLGEETNEAMDSAGAYRRRGLLRFRRSSEAAAKCPVVVRNVPRMRRRKQQKMEVRLRAATMPNSGITSHATSVRPV